MKYVFFLCVSVFLWSCDKNSTPANLLPESDMVKVLYDIHLIEAKISKLNLGSTDSSKMVFDTWETQLFAQYKIDSAVYKQSYRYYASHPEQLNGIYKEVIKKLEARPSTDNNPNKTRPTR